MLRCLSFFVAIFVSVFGCGCEGRSSKEENRNPAVVNDGTVQTNHGTNASRGKAADWLAKNRFEIQTIQSNLMSLRRPENIALFSNVIQRGFEATAEVLVFTNKAKESVTTFSGRIYAVIEMDDGRLSFDFFSKSGEMPVKQVRLATAENRTIFTSRFNREGKLFHYQTANSGFMLHTNGTLESVHGVNSGKTNGASWSSDGRLLNED